MNVIIIGAGTAGCEAAYRLAKAGFTVELVEKECTPGGNLNNWWTEEDAARFKERAHEVAYKIVAVVVINADAVLDSNVN